MRIVFDCASLKTNANSLQIFQYFFYNFFIFSQWPLIFDIIKFNTSLYRFLLKFLKIVGYSSINRKIFVRYYKIYFNCLQKKVMYKAGAQRGSKGWEAPT